jgi:hypothetical protein
MYRREWQIMEKFLYLALAEWKTEELFKYVSNPICYTHKSPENAYIFLNSFI